MKFIGNVIATVIGIFVFCALFFFGLLFISIAIGGDTETVKVKKNSVIELDLSKVSLDYSGKVTFKEINFSDVKYNSLTHVLNAIEKAKTDDDIKGISIKNNTSTLGLAQGQEIRSKLQEFKKSGKFIVAYGNYFSQNDYYLNSIADTIYLNPMGEVDFKGLAAEVVYMKELQEKTGIKMEVLRHGKYKSAVEPYLSQNMSSENREQLTSLLESVWHTIAQDIAESRNIPIDTLNKIANNLEGRTAKMALSNKLIDKIVYEDQYNTAIKNRLKVGEKEDYNSISIVQYAQKVATTSFDYTKKETIAVIYAQGEILGGEGDVNIIGEGAINKSLREARNNDDVKAIVLRVNSPGGSALTSELIWREITLTKEVKPVIVSMGNYAASGGYYIACNANRIFAEPTTITGSIGVFGVLPNMKQLADNIGINAESVVTHKNAQGYSVLEPLNKNFKKITLESIEAIYDIFLERVASGRGTTTKQINEIAQGRVWTGIQAQKIGLVDEIGGLQEAIAYAAKTAEIEDYTIQNLPEYEKSIEDLITNFTGNTIFTNKEALLKDQIGEENYKILEQIQRAKNLKGVQALLPFEIKVK